MYRNRLRSDYLGQLPDQQQNQNKFTAVGIYFRARRTSTNRNIRDGSYTSNSEVVGGKDTRDIDVDCFNTSRTGEDSSKNCSMINNQGCMNLSVSSNI